MKREGSVKIKIKIKNKKRGKKKNEACVGRREKEAWCCGFQTFLNIYKKCYSAMILKN